MGDRRGPRQAPRAGAQEARGDREDDGPAEIAARRRRRLVRPLPRLLPLPAAARLFGGRRRLPDLRLPENARRGQDGRRGHVDHVLVPLLSSQSGDEPARLHPRVPALLLLPQARAVGVVVLADDEGRGRGLREGREALRLPAARRVEVRLEISPSCVTPPNKKKKKKKKKKFLCFNTTA